MPSCGITPRKSAFSIRPFFTETSDNGPTMTALAQLAELAVAAKKLANEINGYGEDATAASKHDAGAGAANGQFH